MAQVLPDSVYVSSPSTEVRRRLLDDGRLEFCFVFENRKLLFPIDSRIKIVLLGAEADAGPTEDVRGRFHHRQGCRWTSTERSVARTSCNPHGTYQRVLRG